MKERYSGTMTLLVALLIIFAIIFLVAFVGLQRKEALLDIRGIPVEFVDWIIMVLSLGSIIKTIWTMHSA